MTAAAAEAQHVGRERDKSWGIAGHAFVPVDPRGLYMLTLWRLMQKGSFHSQQLTLKPS